MSFFSRAFFPQNSRSRKFTLPTLLTFLTMLIFFCFLLLRFSLSTFQPPRLRCHRSFQHTLDSSEFIGQYLFSEILKALNEWLESTHMDTASRNFPCLSCKQHLAPHISMTLQGPIYFGVSPALPK